MGLKSFEYMKENSMLSKKEFCEIIEELKDANDLQKEEVELLRKYKSSLDGVNIGSLMIMHEDLVIRLLNKILGLKKIDELGGTELEWWAYETNYGRYKEYNFVEIHGARIVIDTAGKFYDFIMKEGMYNAN